MLGRLIPWAAEERGLTMTDYQELFTRFGFNGVQYVVPSGNAQDLTALQGAGNPIVSACIHARMLVFSEARFTFQRYSASRPGEMFGTPDLAILERPWPSATTGDLLARMEADASLFGNSYWIRANNELIRLDPAKVIIVTGDVEDRTESERGSSVTPSSMMRTTSSHSSTRENSAITSRSLPR